MPAAAAKPVKVAVDLPAALYEETEQAMHELSMSRSSLIRSAVEMFLRDRRREKLERDIAESFAANRELDRQLSDDFKHVDAEGDFGL